MKKISGLIRGLRCKACNKPIQGDPELCGKCLEVARSLIRDIDLPDDYDTVTKVQD